MRKTWRSPIRVSPAKSSAAARWPRLAAVCLLGVLASPFAGGPLPTARAEDSAETVRAEVGKPLQAAQALIKQGKFKDALAKLHEVDGVPKRTPYENYVLDYTRLSAASSAGDLAQAVTAFEALVASGRLPAATQQQFSLALAGQYYRGGDYANAATWAARHAALGGTDPAATQLRYQSLYQAGDYAAAARELSALVKAEEQAGRKPAEDVLQLLANCHAKRDDKPAYAGAIEKLLLFYPKRDYWLVALQSVAAKPGFPERLNLDLLRLQLATDTVGGGSANAKTVATAWFDGIQRALQAGFAGEAKALADQAFGAGLLGKGAEAEREQRLRKLVEKSFEEDRKTLGQGDAEAAAARSGDALVNQGLNYVGYGEFDKGLALLQQGIAKGALKQPEEAKLHLGYAQLKAGQKAEAVKTWKSVGGSDAAADLARLWLIKAAGA